MTLSQEARARLADVVALQPTKNGELRDHWDLDSGSEVHRYLEAELEEYYYRDEKSLIRATPKAVALIGPPEESEDRTTVLQVPALQRQVLAVLPGPDEESESVVSVLHAVREEFGADPEADDVRSALRSLERKSVVEIRRRTVPTFRFAVEPDSIALEPPE